MCVQRRWCSAVIVCSAFSVHVRACTRVPQRSRRLVGRRASDGERADFAHYSSRLAPGSRPLAVRLSPQRVPTCARHARRSVRSFSPSRFTIESPPAAC